MSADLSLVVNKSKCTHAVPGYERNEMVDHLDEAQTHPDITPCFARKWTSIAPSVAVSAHEESTKKWKVSSTTHRLVVRK